MANSDRRTLFAGLLAAVAGAVAPRRASRPAGPFGPKDQPEPGPGGPAARRPSIAVRPAAGSVKRHG